MATRAQMPSYTPGACTQTPSWDMRFLNLLPGVTYGSVFLLEELAPLMIPCLKSEFEEEEEEGANCINGSQTRAL